MRHLKRRTLVAVANLFNVSLVNAHSASADAEATAAVLHHLVDTEMVPDDVNAALEEQAAFGLTL